MNLSMRQLASIADVPVSTVSDLEAGASLTPQPNTVQALARALVTPVSDLYTAAGWLPADELPSLEPYITAKFQDLPTEAMEELGTFVHTLRERYGRHPAVRTGQTSN